MDSPYRYTIKNTGKSSSHFGPCEICDEHVSEVFYQVKWEKWQGCLLHKGGSFGHHNCLINSREV